MNKYEAYTEMWYQCNTCGVLTHEKNYLDVAGRSVNPRVCTACREFALFDVVLCTETYDYITTI